MSFYPFRATDGSGRYIDIEAPMSKGIPVGTKRVVDGVEYERILAAPRVSVDGVGHFISHQEPRWSPHAKRHCKKTGKPLFISKNEGKEYAARKSGEEDVECRYGEL